MTALSSPRLSAADGARVTGIASPAETPDTQVPLEPLEQRLARLEHGLGNKQETARARTEMIAEIEALKELIAERDEINRKISEVEQKLGTAMRGYQTCTKRARRWMALRKEIGEDLQRSGRTVSRLLPGGTPAGDGQKKSNPRSSRGGSGHTPRCAHLIESANKLVANVNQKARTAPMSLGSGTGRPEIAKPGLKDSKAECR